MFPPREIVLNLAMRSKAVRGRAQRRHNTGVLSDTEAGDWTLHELLSHVPLDTDGLRILELGPGQGISLAQAATGRGAEYAAFDIERYLDPAVTTQIGIDYRVDGSGRLPWPAGVFDLVWSHSVLEHVRDPDALLTDVERVLRPGGYQVAAIDLETHLGGREDPARMYEFLRYPPWLWRLMTSNRSTYVNGLRLSDWRQALRRHGFEIEHEVATAARCGLPALRRVPYLSHLSDEDLLTKHVTITARLATRRGS